MLAQLILDYTEFIENMHIAELLFSSQIFYFILFQNNIAGIVTHLSFKNYVIFQNCLYWKLQILKNIIYMK